MRYEPTGNFVLIEMETFEAEIKDGALAGFVTHSQSEKKREQHGNRNGVIKAFGPTCFIGVDGCKSPSDWGVKVGDRVEFSRYEGNECAMEGFENYRLIPDTTIIAVLRGE